MVVGLLLLSGCDSYLDESPDNRMELNTIEKVEATIVGAYQNNRSFRFTDFSTDNVTFVEDVYREVEVFEDLYTWSRKFRTPKHQDAPSSYWVFAYGTISQANHVLEAIENLKVSKENKARLGALKGEALILRSYSHFMLVNLFAKHYDLTTANSDLGVPYVLKAEKKLIVDYKRETVEKTYELAENDLLEGLKLIEENIELVNKNKYRFTLQTMYNYASRFYLFRNKDVKDVEMNVKYGEKALLAYGGKEQLRSWKEYEKDRRGIVNIEQAEVGLVQSSATWSTGNNIYQQTTTVRDRELRKNPFKANDERIEGSYYIRDGNIFMPVNYFIFAGGGYSATDLFPLNEAILNTAEGYARLENYDKAKELMVVIGESVYARYKPENLTSEKLQQFYKTKTIKEAWLEYILFERRLYSLNKGMRWFDIRRYDIDVIHKLKNNTELKLSDVVPNKDYQIPLFAITAGLTPNK